VRSSLLGVTVAAPNTGSPGFVLGVPAARAGHSGLALGHEPRRTRWVESHVYAIERSVPAEPPVASRRAGMAGTIFLRRP
jgi:hypothetical protein